MNEGKFLSYRKGKLNTYSHLQERNEYQYFRYWYSATLDMDRNNGQSIITSAVNFNYFVYK